MESGASGTGTSVFAFSAACSFASLKACFGSFGSGVCASAGFDSVVKDACGVCGGCWTVMPLLPLLLATAASVVCSVCSLLQALRLSRMLVVFVLAAAI